MPRRLFYGSEESQHGHWYPGDADKPVVTVVHGGYWRNLYTMTMESAVAKDLNRRGYPVWNIEYRRVGEPGVHWPILGQDVLAAIDYADANLVKAGQIVVAHSAGATLGVWAAAQREHLLGAVSRAGVLDLIERGDGDQSMRLLFDLAPNANLRLVKRVFAEASPVSRMPFKTPVRVLHGRNDQTVPYQLSEWFIDNARKNGMDATLQIIETEGHDEFLDPASKSHAATVAAIEELAARSPADRNAPSAAGGRSD
ncbi:alpha/beta hydrolase family protein [Tsukamurella soli]|uniref:Peptidase S9 prolyl oligopeptidase catalytic domain-containing protein n=1 Tax=Tsukamurella soli TaxID=644556 RepID=A0ABP8JD51_9ACTN